MVNSGVGMDTCTVFGPLVLERTFKDYRRVGAQFNFSIRHEASRPMDRVGPGRAGRVTQDCCRSKLGQQGGNSISLQSYNLQTKKRGGSLQASGL